ncbi:MAG: hydrogenase formation protein HypD [Gammaproteobacteria bacterium HGW-Gammaproteobacteria-10]|nr:MAG: hydrogenase formation protein HypD [Gammaproteobacteria bacterium HGW-Gammaproteobacteria-10]
MALDARQWLDKIRALLLTSPVRIMNVCGGHERSISMAGLRSALPDMIDLIPGPGCPVCVCPEEDIYQAIQIGLNEPDSIVVAFGDMLRVPVNVSSKSVRSLEQAKAAGADIRPIASPSEAVRIAKSEPGKTVVFFVAGFETTCAPVAGMLAEGIPDNLLLLMSGRLTWPAVAMLLDYETPSFDALIAPGHVSTVMGPEEWQFVVDRHGFPAAIAGFTPESLLAAIYSVLRQKLDGRIFLDNCYQQVVKPHGNPTARRLIESTLTIVDSPWRGIGIIPASGLELRADYAQHNARLRFPVHAENARKNAGAMPPGCDCARVVLGRIKPVDCKLYGVSCTPRSPVGPCMVSDEGACRIWWSSGIRTRSAEHEETTCT